MRLLICALGLTGFLVSCGDKPPAIPPVIGVHQPVNKPDIAEPVAGVGTEVGKVDANSQALQVKIDALRDTVKNSKNALEKANAKVELLQKQGSAGKVELDELWNLVQDVKARNVVLETSVEDAKITMDNQRLAIGKLNESMVAARTAAAQKDAEVNALRDSVIDANDMLQRAAVNQSKLQQQLAKDQAALVTTKEELANARVYKWWLIGIIATIVLGALAKFLIPILVKSAL